MVHPSSCPHGPEYVRVIDKELAALFPDSESMNAALRSIAQMPTGEHSREK
jgi:hypothetical protein